MAEAESYYENILSTNVACSNNLSSKEVKDVLVKITDSLRTGEDAERLNEIRMNSEEDRVELFKKTFPIITQIQLRVLNQLSIGFTGKDGLKEFLRIAKQRSIEEPEINQLFTAIREQYLPPFSPRSLN